MNTNTLSAQIQTLRARVGSLSARAVAGESINTSGLTDANESINTAVSFMRNGDFDDARESLTLAEEQLDAAES